MKKRGRYPKEFKIEAIRLLNSGDKPASELAMESGFAMQQMSIDENRLKYSRKCVIARPDPVLFC